MHTQKIKPLTKVYVKGGPAIELTEAEESFCRQHGYWPTRSELRIHQPTGSDRAMAQQLADKIKHLIIIYEGENQDQGKCGDNTSLSMN